MSADADSSMPGQLKCVPLLVSGGVVFVANEFDECFQEVGNSSPSRALDKPEKSKLGGAIHVHQDPELAFASPDLRYINVEVANGISLELILRPEGATLQFRQPAEAMTLKTVLQGGADELRDT